MYLARQATRGVERRERKVQLIHLAPDRFDEEPKSNAARKISLAPDVHREARGVLVELAHEWVQTRRIKIIACERDHVGDQPTVRRRAFDAKIFRERNLSIRLIANHAATKRPMSHAMRARSCVRPKIEIKR